MKVVRFLERKNVIRFFGTALILAPILNIFLHILVIKFQSNIVWSQFQFIAFLKQTSGLSAFLALCSMLIGTTLLSGSTKAWKFVLVLLGSHLLVQILNINDKAWKGPLAWPSFLLNAGLFFFIFDQLVWKVQAPAGKVIKNNFKEDVESEAHAAPAAVQKSVVQFPKTSNHREVINLKSYRKIYFSFGSPKPWGELKTLSSEILSVRCLVEPPLGIENKVVQINFAEDVVVDIQFEKREDNTVYFKPLNMNKEKVTNLNKWLNQIAV